MPCGTKKAREKTEHVNHRGKTSIPWIICCIHKRFHLPKKKIQQKTNLMRILWDSNLYKSIILSHLNRWFFSSRRFGGPRIEDLILRSRISPMAIGGLEALLRLEVWRWCRKPLVIDKIIRHPQVIVIIRHPQVIEDTRWLLTKTHVLYIYVYTKTSLFFGWKIFTYICWKPSDSCFCCVGPDVTLQFPDLLWESLSSLRRVPLICNRMKYGDKMINELF